MTCCLSDLPVAPSEAILREFHVERVFGFALQNEEDRIGKIYKVLEPIALSYPVLDFVLLKYGFFFIRLNII